MRYGSRRSRRDDGLAREIPTLVHQHRDGAIGGGTVAELANVVSAPGGEGAVRAERQRVKTTCGEGDDGLAREHPALVHQHRDGALGGGTVAELANLVIAPGGDGAV